MSKEQHMPYPDTIAQQPIPSHMTTYVDTINGALQRVMASIEPTIVHNVRWKEREVVVADGRQRHNGALVELQRPGSCPEYVLTVNGKRTLSTIALRHSRYVARCGLGRGQMAGVTAYRRQVEEFIAVAFSINPVFEAMFNQTPETD